MIKVKHKKAFSMVTAIFVMFIMASLTALIMNVTGKTVKETTQQYQKEQAQLLGRSYTELAILYTLYYDRSSSCLEKITDHFGDTNNGYDIDIRIKYIGNDTLLANCRNSIEADGTFDLTNTNATWTNNSGGFYNTLSLVIDTYIKYRVIDHPLNQNSSTMDDVFITFHRRTLQKL